MWEGSSLTTPRSDCSPGKVVNFEVFLVCVCAWLSGVGNACVGYWLKFLGKDSARCVRIDCFDLLSNQKSNGSLETRSVE